MSAGQSVRHSWIEAFANVFIGFFIGLVSNVLILPLCGVTIDLRQSFLSSIAFTVISVVRSFAIRRFFNAMRYDARLSSEASQ